jgi:hypothetical protein
MKRLAVLALLALPVLATAQMYKWKDEQGRMHFTQVPPKAGIPFETLGAPPPPAEAPNQESLNKSLDDSRKAAPEQQKAADQASEREAQRQQACARAMERLAYLDARTARRLATKDAAGNVTRMDDAEFQRQRTTAQDEINKNCS